MRAIKYEVSRREFLSTSILILNSTYFNNDKTLFYDRDLRSINHQQLQYHPLPTKSCKQTYDDDFFAHNN